MCSRIVFSPSESNSYVSSRAQSINEKQISLTELLEAVGNETEAERPTECRSNQIWASSLST